MTTAELAGPVPRPRRTISGKFAVLGAVLMLVLFVAVYFGFKRRVEQKEARKASQQTASVASDAAVPVPLPETVPLTSLSAPAATPGRIPATVPVNSLYGQPNNAPPVPGGSIAAPFGSAVQTIAHPFPDQPAPAAYAQPVADPQTDLRARAIERSLSRAQLAQESPTGVTLHTAVTATAVDPVAAEMARLNAASLAAPATQQRPPGSGPLGTLLDSNGQDDKERFHQPGESQPAGYLKTTRVPPLSRFVLERGTIIPAALPQNVVSDLPGDLIAEVSRDVFDSPTGKFLLIPAGSRLVGEYNSRVSFGQKRIQISWTAVYFPDGSFLDLGRMPAQSADGGAGLSDQVDNHWKRLIGGVALSSILAAGLSVSQNRSSSGSVLTYPSAGQQAAAAVGTQATETGAQITNRNLNVQPSLKIRPGELFSVFIERDIVFSAPYEAIR